MKAVRARVQKGSWIEVCSRNASSSNRNSIWEKFKQLWTQLNIHPSCPDQTERKTLPINVCFPLCRKSLCVSPIADANFIVKRQPSRLWNKQPTFTVTKVCQLTASQSSGKCSRISVIQLASHQSATPELESTAVQKLLLDVKLIHWCLLYFTYLPPWKPKPWFPANVPLPLKKSTWIKEKNNISKRLGMASCMLADTRLTGAFKSPTSICLAPHRPRIVSIIPTLHHPTTASKALYLTLGIGRSMPEKVLTRITTRSRLIIRDAAVVANIIAVSHMDRSWLAVEAER